MGLSDVNREELPFSEDTTVAEIVDEYGYEATKRGLNYLTNLPEADRNYRESHKKSSKYEEGVKDGYSSEDELDGDVDTERWEEGVKGGLGVDE